MFNPIIIGRNCFWSNFNIVQCETKKRTIGSMNGKFKKNWYAKKQLIERNAVDSKLGLHIFNCAYGKENKELLKYLN